MTMNDAAEIESSIEEAAEAARKATINDVLIDLREALGSVPAAERAGLLAAIEIIDANYVH